MSKLSAGDKAPDFKLEGSDGASYTLEDIGKAVLYFYPKDNTPGCTIQAVDFTSHLDSFAEKGYKVFGVSADSIESHCNFVEKQDLKIVLLSDPDKEVASAFGAFGEKKLYGKSFLGIIRSTFIIDNGVIAEAMYNVKAKGHVEKVLGNLS